MSEEIGLGKLQYYPTTGPEHSEILLVTMKVLLKAMEVSNYEATKLALQVAQRVINPPMIVAADPTYSDTWRGEEKGHT